MDALSQARELLPAEIGQALERETNCNAEEIRLRVGMPPTVLIAGREKRLSETGFTQAQLMQVLEKATGASLHSCTASLSRGYISYRGLRIGVCGQAVCSDGELTGFRSYSSAAIRIPHQCRGICNTAVRQIISDGVKSTLIAAAPGVGKTTALREIVRCISEKRVRVAVADERNELSAYNGSSYQFDLGPCTDVMVDVPKAQALMMLLRGMNPQVAAMDEITQPEDIKAIVDIAGCGVAVIATAHGSSLEDMLHRPLYRELISAEIFEKLLTITVRDGSRSYRLEELRR